MIQAVCASGRAQPAEARAATLARLRQQKQRAVGWHVWKYCPPLQSGSVRIHHLHVIWCFLVYTDIFTACVIAFLVFLQLLKYRFVPHTRRAVAGEDYELAASLKRRIAQLVDFFTES